MDGTQIIPLGDCYLYPLSIIDTRSSSREIDEYRQIIEFEKLYKHHMRLFLIFLGPWISFESWVVILKISRKALS